MSIPAAGPDVTFTRPSFRVYLYKVNPNQSIWKLLHGDFLSGKFNGWAGVGPDPADLEVPSTSIFSNLTLGGSSLLQRFPFDSWMPRKIGISADAQTGLPTSKNDIIDAAAPYYAYEDLDATLSRLNWKNMHGGGYQQDLTRYLNAKREDMIAAIKTLADDFSTDRNKAINRYDLSGFALHYSHDTTSETASNTVNMTLVSDPMAFMSAGGGEIASSAAYGENHNVFQVAGGDSVPVLGSTQDIPVIDENDIIEIRVKYLSPDNDKWGVTEGGFTDADGFHRVFMGFITRQCRSLAYANTEKVSLTIDGPSKMLQIFDTAFVPSPTQAVGQIFAPDTEMRDLNFTLWGNNFTSMTADQVFGYLMQNVMYSPKYKGDLNGTVFQPTSFSGVEKSTGGVKPPPAVDADFYIADTRIDDKQLSFQFISYLPILMGLAREYAAFDANIEVQVDPANPDVQTLKYSTPGNKRDEVLNKVLGCEEQSTYLAYKAMIRKSMEMYYPELKRPGQILDDLRANTMLECFEDRPGVLRIRPPKFNVINLNPGITEYADAQDTPIVQVRAPMPDNSDFRYIELNGEYVISPEDISGFDLSKDDYSMLTRVDHTWELPIAGALDMSSYTGHWTSPGQLLRYGLRTSGPRHNPMSLSIPVAASLSAVYMSLANKDTRTVTCTVFNNREYRVGRLYYIPVSVPSSMGAAKVVSRGIVGYVTTISTEMTRGQLFHRLSLSYVRQAEVLEVPVAVKGGTKNAYYANFKRLPDIATYMRLLASDPKFFSTAEEAFKNAERAKDAPDSGATCGQSDSGLITIQNGLTNKQLKSEVLPVYSDTLNSDTGLGIGAFAAPGDRSLDPERNIFLTPFSANAWRDPSDNSMYINNHFLAKLLVYDYDASLKIYPTRLSNLNIFSSALNTPQVPMPTTESMSVRYTDDLLRVIHQQIYWGIISKYGGPTFNPDNIQLSKSKFQSSGGIRFIATSDSPDAMQGHTQVNIVVATGGHHDSALLQDTIVAFVQTNPPSNRISPVPAYTKCLVFHVPYFKSLRLAEMLNNGIPPGFGYRSHQTIAQLAKAAGKSKPDSAESDSFHKGQSVLFTNFDNSLWELGDILDSCTEFDLSTANSSSVAPEEGTDGNHFLEALINYNIEPYNYIHGFNYAYKGNAAVSLDKSYKTITLLVARAWGILSGIQQITTVFGGNLPTSVHEVDRSTRVLEDVNYLKSSFVGGPRQVWVPAYHSFFNTQYTNIFNQVEPSVRSIGPAGGSTQKSLEGSVFNRFLVQNAGTTLVVGPRDNNAVLVKSVQNPNDYNFTLKLFRDRIKPVVFSTASAASDAGINLFSFCSGGYPGYGLCAFLLRNNMTVVPPGVQNNAVSYIWHGAYNRGAVPFQTNSSTPEFHKMNLPLVDPSMRGL